MPEYLYPGVYVEEVDTGNKPIEGVSTSTVGFLGIAERGPLKPSFLTSFGDYQRMYGGRFKENGVDRFLTYGVEGFFQNGGLRCWVARVAHTDATQGTPAPTANATFGSLQVSAIGPGAWGNRVAVRIDAGSTVDPNNPTFKLTLMYWPVDPPK